MKGDILTYSFKSLDEQAFSQISGIHPAYFPVATTTEWLLGLGKPSTLFEGDALPKSLGSKGGMSMSFEKFFDKIDGWVVLSRHSL